MSEVRSLKFAAAFAAGVFFAATSLHAAPQPAAGGLQELEIKDHQRGNAKFDPSGEFSMLVMFKPEIGLRRGSDAGLSDACLLMNVGNGYFYGSRIVLLPEGASGVYDKPYVPVPDKCAFVGKTGESQGIRSVPLLVERAAVCNKVLSSKSVAGWAAGVTLFGAHTWARPVHDSSPGLFTHRDDAQTFLKLISLGRLSVDGYVADVRSPADCADVYARLANGGAFPITQFDWTRL